MTTKCIRFESTPDGGKRAFVVVYLHHDQTERSYAIKEAKSEFPFYMVDGARHDLTPKEKAELRKEIPGR